MNVPWGAKASKSNPCPACGKPDHCVFSRDDLRLRCNRSSEAPVGWRLMTLKPPGAVFARIGAAGAPVGTRPRSSDSNPSKPKPPSAATRKRLEAALARCRSAMEPDRLAAVERATRVPGDAWARLGIGWADAAELKKLKANGQGWGDDFPDGAFAIPERDGAQRLVGLAFRTIDGRKGAKRGCRRGLTIPEDRVGLRGPALAVEGASDVAACASIGIGAIGRPSNAAGGLMLAELLKDEDVLVVGENDEKPDGRWPGREGARGLAQQLATEWGKPVRWTLPPAEHKDVRGWITARGINYANAAAVKTAGEDLLAALKAAAVVETPPEPMPAIRGPEAEAMPAIRGMPAIPFRVENTSPTSPPLQRGELDALLAGAQVRPKPGQAMNRAVDDAVLRLVTALKLDGRFGSVDEARAVFVGWMDDALSETDFPESDAEAMIHRTWRRYDAAKGAASLAAIAFRARAAPDLEALPASATAPFRLAAKIARELAGGRTGAEFDMVGGALGDAIGRSPEQARRYLRDLMRLGILTRLVLGAHYSECGPRLSRYRYDGPPLDSSAAVPADDSPAPAPAEAAAAPEAEIIDRPAAAKPTPDARGTLA